jgi:hypothetical protein
MFQNHSILCQNEFESVICYGIGRIEVFRNARCQLALLIAILRRKRVQQLSSRENFEFFDPMLNHVEIEAIKALGGIAISTNEQGKRRASNGPSFFYMPHCVRALYNNVLWANWGKATLESIVIVGNSFNGYMDQIRPTKRGKTDSDPLTRNCIEAVHQRGCVVEKIFENDFPVISSFNDLSTHVFHVSDAEIMREEDRPDELIAENDVFE